MVIEISLVKRQGIGRPIGNTKRSDQYKEVRRTTQELRKKDQYKQGNRPNQTPKRLKLPAWD